MLWSNLLDPFWLIVAVLATARITSVIHSERIGWPIRWLAGGRVLKGGDGDIITYPDTFFGHLFQCYWCLSFWVALGTVIVLLVFPYILIPFALSMGAIIIFQKGT